MLVKEPGSLLALRGLIHALSDDEIPNALELLELKLQLNKRDPYCETEWNRQAFSIERSANTLIEAHKNNDTRTEVLREEALLEWFRSAKRSIMSIYEIAFERSRDEDKLYYAWRRINPRLATDLLDDNPVEHEMARQADVIEELEAAFGLNSVFDRTQALRMMCNDTAFEIGLFQTCTQLIEHYAKKDALVATDLTEDVVDAGVRALVASTRDRGDLVLDPSAGSIFAAKYVF